MIEGSEKCPRVPAASNSTPKFTSMASSRTWELNDGFDTKFYATAEVQGVVDGDLDSYSQKVILYLFLRTVGIGNRLETGYSKNNR